MTAIELIKAGKLTEARGALVEAVKASPGDNELRILLFKVLAFLGEWDKALLHLQIVAVQATAAPEIPVYQNLVAAEMHREEVRRHQRIPEFLAEPPAYLPEFLAARDELDRGSGELLASLLPVLEESVGSLRGTVNGVAFEGMVDLDATLLPFLEVFIHDRYLWFPLTSLRELSVAHPSTLLDLLWSRARIVTWDGLTTECFIPVLYPGTWSHVMEDVRLGRVTDWEELGGGYYRGVGQHTFVVGDEEIGLLQLGEVNFQFGAGERS